MQDKPDKKSPRTLRLNARDNIIVAIDPVMPERDRAGHHGDRAHHARPQDGGAARSPRASRSSSSARSSASPPRTSRPAATSTPTTARSPSSSATTPSPRTRARSSCCRPRPRATFEGYRRANGKAGTRNYIGVLTSVNCSASVARFMAEAVNALGHSRATIPTSTASSRSCTAPAAASPTRARATRRWSARSGAMPAIPTSPARWSSASAARCSRSRA